MQSRRRLRNRSSSGCSEVSLRRSPERDDVVTHVVDEISEGLQPSVIQRLSKVLREERDRLGIAILLVEQNVKFALATADRYAVLKRGEIIESGQVADGAEARITHHLSV